MPKGHLPPLTRSPQGLSGAGPGADSAVHWTCAAAWYVHCQHVCQVQQVAEPGAAVILLWPQDLAALRWYAAMPGVVSGPWAVLVKCSAHCVADAPSAAALAAVRAAALHSVLLWAAMTDGLIHAATAAVAVAAAQSQGW